MLLFASFSIYARTFILCSPNVQNSELKHSFFCSKNTLQPTTRQSKTTEHSTGEFRSKRSSHHTVSRRQQTSMQCFPCNAFSCENIGKKMLIVTMSNVRLLSNFFRFEGNPLRYFILNFLQNLRNSFVMK